MEFGTMEFTIVDSNEQEGRWSYSDKRDVERTLNGIKEALYTCEAVVIMIHSHEIKPIRNMKQIILWRNLHMPVLMPVPVPWSEVEHIR